MFTPTFIVCAALGCQPVTCQGEYTGNSKIDTDDILHCVNNWGECNTDDLLSVIGNWGECGAKTMGVSFDSTDRVVMGTNYSQPADGLLCGFACITPDLTGTTAQVIITDQPDDVVPREQKFMLRILGSANS